MKHALRALLVLTLLAPVVAADNCHDTLFIDSTAYPIPEWWCGYKIDSLDLADPATLVRLPVEMCYDSSRIYVNPDTKEALLKMTEQAQKDSVFLIVKSGYRSPAYQRRILKRRLDSGAVFDEVIKIVAPPGYSEHHTGRAVDFANNGTPFYKSKSYRWLKINAADYGFRETYPQDDSGAVRWEPWHWYLPSEKK